MDFKHLLAEPGLAPLLELLNAAGEETRVVGGAVRNALMGLPVNDIDLATTALPEVVASRARRAGLRALPTGIEHGTVTVLAADRAFEVTTLREDVETDGRHAKVRFGRDFEQDAQRRDFTINALTLSADGALHDSVGGAADIAARRVRFIGDPARRIAEDHLRSLRFFRFHAAYGAGEPDAAGLAAVIFARAGLLTLSRERVRAEMLKLLAAPGAAAVAEILSQTGLFGLLTGSAAWPARLAALMRQPERADPLLRLAALALWTSEGADRLRERLRLSNQEHKRLSLLAQALEGVQGRAPPAGDDLRALLFLHGREPASDALRLAQAMSDDPGWAMARGGLARMEAPRLPVSGADLLARGASGPRLGRILKAFQAAWIRAGFPEDPGELSRLIDAASTIER